MRWVDPIAGARFYHDVGIGGLLLLGFGVGDGVLAVTEWGILAICYRLRLRLRLGFSRVHIMVCCFRVGVIDGLVPLLLIVLGSFPGEG